MSRWLESAVTPSPRSTSALRGQCARGFAFVCWRACCGGVSSDSFCVFLRFRRIVCDMAEALLPHSPGGPVELCIGVCSAEYRTLSTQTYSFVVSVGALSQ